MVIGIGVLGVELDDFVEIVLGFGDLIEFGVDIGSVFIALGVVGFILDGFVVFGEGFGVLSLGVEIVASLEVGVEGGLVFVSTNFVAHKFKGSLKKIRYFDNPVSDDLIQVKYNTHCKAVPIY